MVFWGSDEFELIIKAQYEQKLEDLNCTFWRESSCTYCVSPKGLTTAFKINLFTSEINSREKLISPNGNSLLSVAKFRIRQVKLANSEYTVLGFINMKTLETEFVVISTNEFVKKLSIREPESINSQIVNLRFWLMEDRSLFETVNMSLEGEWYFLSKGFNGRLADKEEWCFTSYLNNWGPIACQSLYS